MTLSRGTGRGNGDIYGTPSENEIKDRRDSEHHVNPTNESEGLLLWSLLRLTLRVFCVC